MPGRDTELIYWMEQQRDFKLRHPSLQMTAEGSRPPPPPCRKQSVSQGLVEATVMMC